MNSSILVVDNFYDNVDQVRATALSCDFSVKGNYPGQRTNSYLNDSIQNCIQNLIGPLGGHVTYWGTEYSGAFQYTIASDESWIHCDQYNTWAGVCYLTPDAPHSAGTGLFRHKETSLCRKPDSPELEAKLNSEGNDLSKWDLTDIMSNKYNRIVFYRGDMYHRSLDYFGEDKFTGRLFQTFFFNTEF